MPEHVYICVEYDGGIISELLSCSTRWDDAQDMVDLFHPARRACGTYRMTPGESGAKLVAITKSKSTPEPGATNAWEWVWCLAERNSVDG